MNKHPSTFGPWVGVLRNVLHWLPEFPQSDEDGTWFDHAPLFVCFSAPHLPHVEVPRLGVQLELQLPAYTTATATSDPRCIYDLHHSSWQHQILNPLSEARGQTHILMDTSRVCTSEPQWKLHGSLFEAVGVKDPPG